MKIFQHILVLGFYKKSQKFDRHDRSRLYRVPVWSEVSNRCIGTTQNNES